MKVGILDKPDPNKGGIDTFIKNVNPYLLDNFKDTERVRWEGIRDSYPLSQTIQQFSIKRRLEKKLEEFETVFVPSQTMMLFDPETISAEVVVYVHDILPATTNYCLYDDSSLKVRMEGYLGTLMANRYVKFLSKADKIVAASEVTEEDIRARTGFQGSSSVVYQGVDCMPDPKDRERNIDLLYVGSLLDRKNPEFIRKAMQKANGKGYSVAHVNFEEVDLPGKSYNSVSDEKLAQLYSRSRFYLHPSLAEGFGRGAVEAQRYGAIPLALDRKINHEILGTEGRSWYSIDQSNDVLRALDASCEADRERAKENAANYGWTDTRRDIAEELMK